MSGSPGEGEVVIVVGKRRFGKSTWLDKYLRPKPRRFVFDPFRKFPAEYLSEEQLIEKHEAGLFLPSNSPKLSVGSCTLADLDLLAAIAYLNGHAHFIIEECGVTFTPGAPLSEPMQEAIFLGGHNWLSLVFVAQRAVSIPVALRSQETRVVSFRQTEADDVRRLKSNYGERAEELRTLDKLECLDAQDNEISRYKIRWDI